MAPELERPRPNVTATLPPAPRQRWQAPDPASPPGHFVPSGPPLIAPGAPSQRASTPGPPTLVAVQVAAPAVPTAPPRRGRPVPTVFVVAAVALACGGVYLAFSGDDDEDPSLGTDPSPPAVSATFAVDLSTGGDVPTPITGSVPSPTLPLPSISLPLPGAWPTTVG